MSEGMFGLGATSECLRFSPKAAQVDFFAKYILSKEDNLGALWDPDAPPYTRLLSIGELEFADVVTHRYSVAIDAMHQTMQAAMTRMLDGKPRGRNEQVKLACSVMDRVKAPRAPWWGFEDYLVKSVSVALTVVTGGDLVVCCNMFLTANEVGKALSDLDRVKVRMLLAAEGEAAQETMELWANEWDKMYLQLSRFRIAFGTELQNGTHAPSNAFHELFVATIIGLFDPGLVFQHARKFKSRSDQSYVLERFLNERNEPGTFNVSVMPNFFDTHFKPNARAVLTLFDWQTYGEDFDLTSGGVGADAVLKRALMRDTIRGRLRSLSVDFFSDYTRRETTFWLPVVAYMLRQFGEMATMALLDEVLMHLHGLICWYMIVAGYIKKKAMGNYAPLQQRRGQSGAIPDLLRCFTSSANPLEVKEALLRVLASYRSREGAALVAKLATLTLEKRGAGPGADLPTVTMFLRIYEDTLRLKAFSELDDADKTLKTFNARYSSVAQDGFNSALAREHGPAQAEHFIALAIEPKKLHTSWTRSKKAVVKSFGTSLGNLCLCPSKPNISASNEPPMVKARRFKRILGGIEEEQEVEEAPAEADEPEVADESEESDASDEEDDDEETMAAPEDEEEDAGVTVWKPDLERCYTLNDLLVSMADGDFTTTIFGERLNRMHRSILVHLGYSERDLAAPALSHFYITDDKRLKKAPPSDLPGFPTGAQYKVQAPQMASRRMSTRKRRAAAVEMYGDDDDDEEAGDASEEEEEEPEAKPRPARKR